MSIKRISLRFNLEKENDCRAWEYLQEAKQSHSKAVISALNAYQDMRAEEQRQAAFLERIITTIENTVKTTAPANAVSGLLQLLGQAQNASVPVATENPQSENDDAALDFLDNF